MVFASSFLKIAGSLIFFKLPGPEVLFFLSTFKTLNQLRNWRLLTKSNTWPHTDTRLTSCAFGYRILLLPLRK
jgi:hypothetical protein